MHVLGRRRNALGAALMLAVLAAFAPAPAAAKPAPEYKPQGFRLFARSTLRWVGNRVQCFLQSSGQICSAESSVIGGGYWPAGTNNQYAFNTGLQVAGIVDSNSVGNPWRGDIEGAFFFNARGGGNGTEVTQIYNSADANDLANWPTAAYVPAPPDPSAALFHPALQGNKTASDNDVWFLSWEGDPAMSAGRRHPLGLLVETRGLAYNTPGKNDVLFFIYTFYNVTSGQAADYDLAPARIRSTLVAQGARFQALNNAKLATSLPAGGYTINNMYLAFGADMDVTSDGAGDNYDGVNIPMALGYTYHKSFTAPGSWTFDPSIYQPPFFPGAGFVGVKYLKSPEDTLGNQVGLTLFGATTNGGEFSDPRNTQALYRYLTGNPDPTLGDDQCNVGDVKITKICYLNQGAAADMRFFQASGPLTLKPGEFSSIAVAYIFAPPVATAACTGPDVCTQVRPQDPTGRLLQMFSPDSLLAGSNTIDSITGFLSYAGDVNPANLKIDEDEMNVVPGSLLGKAKVAQAVFNTGFNQPAPPKAPQFYLVPGDESVAVLWQPSITETDGDPYFSASQQPANYDPNYRQIDVAGYRIYRGLRRDESNLTLLVQYDLLGDEMVDRTGQINSMDGQGFTDCAPDLAIYTTCAPAGSLNGVNLIAPATVSLDGPVTQYQSLIESGGRGYATKADTALTGGNSGNPELSGTGVPFIFVDSAGNCARCGVRNHTRYFYMVTAFDLNSVRSGPSSLESNRSGPKAVIPTPPPANAPNISTFTSEIRGRGVPLTDRTVPTIDPVTGRFSKPFPPSDAATLGLSGFVASLLPPTGALDVMLDSISLGQADIGGPAIPVQYFWTLTNGTATVHFTMPIQQSSTSGTTSGMALFDAVSVDSALAVRYGVPTDFVIGGRLDQSLVGNYYTSVYGRGCVNGATGFAYSGLQKGCDYNGPRWFMGPSPANNETKADPIYGNADNAATPAPKVDRSLANNAGWNNGGELTGVDVIHQPYAYQTMGNGWRAVNAVLGGAKRAADYNVYWNATTAGLIDSVIDVTHNVPLALDSLVMKTGYGILNHDAAQPSGVGVSNDNRTELTATDFGCVEPLRSRAGGNTTGGTRCGGAALGDGPQYVLSRQAAIGAIAFWDEVAANSRTSTFTGQGFGMWLAGNTFIFQTTSLPQGVVWSMRDYVGAITGGNGWGGNDGPYKFYPVTRPFSAPGVSFHVEFTTQNALGTISNSTLRGVHTVPDPYYVTSQLEQSSDQKIIKFVNLPSTAIIRIYSTSGVLVRVIEHNSQTSNEEVWDVRNRNGQFVASGVYFWHVEALGGRRVGRMTIVNFAK